MYPPREPAPLRGVVYHPGAGFHSYPPPKDRSPRLRTCTVCDLPAQTNAPTCPVCGARYAVSLRQRLAHLVHRRRT